MRQRPKSIRLSHPHNAHAVGRHCSSPGSSTLPTTKCSTAASAPIQALGPDPALPYLAGRDLVLPSPTAIPNAQEEDGSTASPSRPDPDMRSQHLAAVTGVRCCQPMHPFGPVAFAGITDKSRLKKKKIQWQSLLHLAPDLTSPRQLKEPISLLSRETPLRAAHIEPQ